VELQPKRRARNGRSSRRRTPRRIDVRVVAPPIGIGAAMGEGTLRRPHYRLAVIPVQLPALRQRRSDIPAGRHFQEYCCGAAVVSGAGGAGRL
jgi:transcriptional regulator with PAS, ATPase and Fis domain